MNTNNDRIEFAAVNTVIFRFPEQKLATFGETKIKYYMVTRPVYEESGINNSETILRRGIVIAEKPRIVTPYYLSRLDGFSPEARNYFDRISKIYGTNSPGIYYSYRNQSENLSIIPDTLDSVVDKINKDIEDKKENLSAIILGIDDLWDVSLLKFIYEITIKSVDNNLRQMESSGLLKTDSNGIPFEARLRIEELFEKLALAEIPPHILLNELKYWGLFEVYQDRFFSALKTSV
jgi:hypothetical protein